MAQLRGLRGGRPSPIAKALQAALAAAAAPTAPGAPPHGITPLPPRSTTVRVSTILVLDERLQWVDWEPHRQAADGHQHA